MALMNELERNVMEKIIRASQRLDKAISIVWAVLIALAGTGIVALLIVTAVPGPVVDVIKGRQGPFTVDLSVMKLWMSSPSPATGDVRAFTLSLAVAIAVCLVFALVAIRLLRRILSEMKQGHPFSPNIATHIRGIAYVIFACAFLEPVLPLVPACFIVKLSGVEQVVSASPMVEKVEFTFHYSTDILAVLISFVVLLLSFVFDYGAKLQQEPDETL